MSRFLIERAAVALATRSAPTWSLEDENPEAAYVNKGDQAWQLTAATLVAMQSIPGLVAIYSGLVKKKWAINSAFMAFYAYAAVLICWVIWGYKMVNICRRALTELKTVIASSLSYGG